MPGEAAFHFGWTYKGGKKNDDDGAATAAGLRAPAPPSGVITTSAATSAASPGHASNATAAHYTTTVRPPLPPPLSLSSSSRQSAPIQTLSAERAHHSHGGGAAADPLQSAAARFASSPHSSTAAARRHSTRSYFAALPEMVFCFCCCPSYKCVLWACALELIVSMFCWYKILGLVLRTINHVELKDAFLIFILTFWIVTLFTATGLLIASHRRKNASYVLPRLIQQVGLLIVGVIFAFTLASYFMGFADVINGWILRIYQLFTEAKMTPDDEREMGRDIRTAALICIPIILLYIPYVVCNLFITRRYHNKLKSKYGSGFHAVSQNEPAEPTAPPPPTNPHYKA